MSAIAPKLSGTEALCSNLIDQTARACEITKEAAAIAAEVIATRSEMVLENLREQERQLDSLDMEINDAVAVAITRVNETEFHELLVCLKFALGLEHIGGMLLSVGDSVGSAGWLAPEDTRDLVRMATVLETMLLEVGAALSSRSITNDSHILQSVAEMDRVQALLFSRHQQHVVNSQRHDSAMIVFMAQSVQRAADHAKHLGEHVCQMMAGAPAIEITQDEPVKQVFLDWLQCRERTIRRSALEFNPIHTTQIRIRPSRLKRLSCR